MEGRKERGKKGTRDMIGGVGGGDINSHTYFMKDELGRTEYKKPQNKSDRTKKWIKNRKNKRDKTLHTIFRCFTSLLAT